MRALAFDELDLRRVTLVGQDWGGLIGLRLAAEHPDRFARIVVANTGLPTGDLPMPEIWWQFRKAIQGMPEIEVGRFVEVGLPSADERRRPRRLRRARSPTTPTARGRARCRAWCRPHPTTRPPRPTGRRGRRCRDSTTPMLVAFSDGDPITGAMAPIFSTRCAVRRASSIP